MKFLLSKHRDAQGMFAALLIQGTITLYNRQYQCQLDQPFTFDGCMADMNPRSTLHPDEMLCPFVQLDK